METKLFSLILLTAIVLVGIVSAAAFTATLDGDLKKSDDTVVLTITDTSSSAHTVTISPISNIDDGFGNSLSVTASNSSVALSADGTGTLNLVYSGDTSDFAFGTFSTNVVLTSGADTLNKTLNFVSSFCDAGIVGESYKLDIKKFKLKTTGYGQEDNEWYPLDDIEIELRIENDGNTDIDDVTIEACLYDIANDDCVMDEDDMELTDNSFRIKDGDEEKVFFNFKVDPDLLSDEIDYTLYVKVYDDDLGEDVLCTQSSEDITIIRDKHFVVLDNIEIPDAVSCDEDIELTADIWNIGEEDEDDVYVRIYNAELGIDDKVNIGTIDTLEKEGMSYILTVPKDADEKSYALKFTAYDEDDDIFENDNDDKAEFTHALKVEGKCQAQPGVTGKDAQISATLETQDVRAGNEVIIRATVRNTGAETTSYSIGVDGYEFFSTIQSITPSTLTLNVGQSADVTITLKLNEDASGENIFYIRALFDSEEEVRQPVSLTIQSGSGFGITGGAIGTSLRENWFIWLIVIINIILIVAIIIVAARMSRA